MVNTLSEVPNSYGFMGKRAHINYPLYRETAEREKVIGRCFSTRKDVQMAANFDRFFTLPMSEMNKLCINPTHGYHSPLSFAVF